MYALIVTSGMAPMRVSLAVLLGLVSFTALCTPVLAEPDRVEISYWESVRDSKSPAELEAYLRAYPDGTFASLARIRLKALQEGQSKPDAPGAADDGTSVSPNADAAKGRIQGTDGPAETLTLNAKLAKREINGEQRTVLGVNINDFSEHQRSCFGLSEAGGALVHSIFPDSPAADAGVNPGDIIREFDGKYVESARSLVGLVTAQPAGVTAKLGVLRPRVLKDGATELKERAATNDTDAALCFAFVHVNGFGVQKDVPEAVRWYRKAAEAGNTRAMFNLAVHLANGNGITKDITEANRWLRRAAEGGSADAMVNLAFQLENGNGITKDVTEANRWYRTAAEAGNATAMHNLANNLANGQGVAKDDVAASSWYHKAVALGHTDSFVALGLRFEQGRGVAKDEAEAVRLYREAANRDDGPAMYMLASNLQVGRGAAKDEAEAARWYRKSAEKGTGAAMAALSEAHDRGAMGLEKDPRVAAEWLYKAIDAGDEYAPARLVRNPELYSRQLRREFQRRLQDTGYYRGEVDGNFGSSTQSAIKTLQADGAKRRQTASETTPVPPSSPPVSPPPADLGNVKELDELD